MLSLDYTSLCQIDIFITLNCCIKVNKMDKIKIIKIKWNFSNKILLCGFFFLTVILQTWRIDTCLFSIVLLYSYYNFCQNWTKIMLLYELYHSYLIHLIHSSNIQRFFHYISMFTFLISCVRHILLFMLLKINVCARFCLHFSKF